MSLMCPKLAVPWLPRDFRYVLFSDLPGSGGCRQPPNQPGSLVFLIKCIEDRDSGHLDKVIADS
jgi:hypothetical protein